MLSCALLFMGFFVILRVGFFFSILLVCSFHDQTHAVILEHNCLKLEACAGSFLEEKLKEALRKLEESFTLSGVEIGFILWTVAIWFRLPSPHHGRRAEKADAVMLWRPVCKAELNHS